MDDTDEFTLEKMRNLIMESPMCREDKNCGGCKLVNFCALWTGRWPTSDFDGKPLETYSEEKVKDLPVTIVWRIAKATDTSLSHLVSYLKENKLFLDNEHGYTRLVKKND